MADARTATAGIALGAIGGFGLVAFADQLMVVGQAARLDEHRGAMLALLELSYNSPQAGLSYLLLVLGALGWVLLGVVLYRSRAVPRAAAVLAALGGAGVLVTAPGPLVWLHRRRRSHLPRRDGVDRRLGARAMIGSAAARRSGRVRDG